MQENPTANSAANIMMSQNNQQQQEPISRQNALSTNTIQ
jgi:hypothetical protein